MCTHDEGFTVILWPGKPRLAIQVCNKLCGYFVPIDNRAWRRLLFKAREQYNAEVARSRDSQHAVQR